MEEIICINFPPQTDLHVRIWEKEEGTEINKKIWRKRRTNNSKHNKLMKTRGLQGKGSRSRARDRNPVTRDYFYFVTL